MKNVIVIVSILGAIVFFALRQVETESPPTNASSSVPSTGPIIHHEKIASTLLATQPATSSVAASKLSSSFARVEQYQSHPEATLSIVSTSSNEVQSSKGQDSEVQEMLKFIEGKSNESIADTMKFKFDSEVIDYEWSSAYEQKVQDFFRETPEFSEFSPTAIECRSSHCRVAVIVTDGMQAEEASRVIMSSIEKSSLGASKKSVFVVNEAAGLLEFYVARDAESNLY